MSQSESKELAKEVLHRIQQSVVSGLVPFPTIETVQQLCQCFITILAQEPIIVEIDGSVNIAGDLHGNLLDLLYIFSIHGLPAPDNQFLFLGDYVDRGSNSTETILLLMCLKILYPENIFLLRGNHEFRRICNQYGFHDECINRFNQKNGELIFDSIVNTFL